MLTSPSSASGEQSRIVQQTAGSGGSAVGWTIAASWTVGAGVGGGAGGTDGANTTALAVTVATAAMMTERAEIFMASTLSTVE